MKKLTKTELFYKELKELIHSNVTLDLNNIKDIKDKVAIFLKEQKYLKNPYSKYSSDLLHFIIAEKMLDLIEINLSDLNKKKIIYPFTYDNYEIFVIQKINNIGLYFVNNCSPDIITGKFLEYKKTHIRNIYYDFNEETRRKREQLELLRLKDALLDLNSNNLHIIKTINNINQELQCFNTGGRYINE